MGELRPRPQRRRVELRRGTRGAGQAPEGVRQAEPAFPAACGPVRAGDHDRAGHGRRAVPRLHAGTRGGGRDGKNWLFFGKRNYTHDFLYQLEWQDWAKSGQLSRIDLAFSRDQRDKVYVQHRMWEARRELFAWLEDGASLYVCGDAKAMAKDVQDTLTRIIADQSGRSEEEAVTYLRGLIKAGRYLKDVY